MPPSNPFHWEPRNSPQKTLWMEMCQIGYMRAVAAQACCSMGKPEPDVHKLDHFVTHEAAATPIGIQLKCTGLDVVTATHVNFTLDKKTYNVLRRKDNFWRFLVVLPLPITGDWVKMGTDWLEIRRSMYWFSFRGEPALKPGLNSISIKIPLTQIVTPEWLAGVFKQYVESDA